jgi:nitroreductase
MDGSLPAFVHAVRGGDKPDAPADDEVPPRIIAAMLARRSIREGFYPRPIPDSILREIVRCGLAAPSSKNAQPWRMHVVTDPAALGGLADAVEHAEGAEGYVPHDPSTGLPRPAYVSTVRESAQVLRDVSAAIFVENRGLFSNGRSALIAATRPALAGSLVGFGLEMIGIGAAIENMWLAAEALGVRVAFMGDVVIAEDAIRASLGIAGDLVGVLALGFSDAPPPSRRQRLDERDAEHVVWHQPGS